MNYDEYLKQQLFQDNNNYASPLEAQKKRQAESYEAQKQNAMGDYNVSQVAQTASQPSGNESAADTAGGAMMMSGNPYAIGAGAVLKVLSASQARKRQKKQQDAQNIMAGTNAMAQSIVNTPVVG